jgi:hydroxymethylpyrimidine/phosphomethylpyrimidine kinase
LEEIAERKIQQYINFILDEKAHKSTKVGLLESKKGIEFTKETLEKFDYETLTKIVKFINN